MSSLEWQTALGYAEDSAEASRKAILLYFYDPECIGCRQMDSVTYSSDEVIQFVNNYMIPVRIDYDKRSAYMQYNVFWTPTLFVLDYQGNEVQQTTGFLEPDKFLALMYLGLAKVHLAYGDFDAANVHFKRLFEKYPTSSAVPEALYFSGVNQFKQKNDPKQLKQAYVDLQNRYPDSSWTKRAVPYSHL